MLGLISALRGEAYAAHATVAKDFASDLPQAVRVDSDYTNVRRQRDDCGLSSGNIIDPADISATASTVQAAQCIYWHANRSWGDLWDRPCV